MALRPDNGNHPLLLATGAVVIWWGRIEGLIFQETMNLGLHPEVEKAGICKPLQISTERLIAQWAKASRLVLSDTPPWQDEISRVKGELTECAETRHLLVHGFWDYPNPDQEPLVCKITLLKPDRSGEVQMAQYLIDYPTLAEFHNRLSRLYHELLGITGYVAVRVPLGRRPKAELSDPEANQEADPSQGPAPSQKRSFGLYRDWE